MSAAKRYLSFVTSEWYRWRIIFLLEVVVLILAAVYSINNQANLNYGPCNNLNLALGAIFAVVFGLYGFSWMLSGTGTDFYFSLPLKRKVIFIVQYLMGIVLFMVPFMFVQGILGVMEYSRGGVEAGRVADYFAWGNITVLAGFLVLYHLVIVFCLLCGNVISVILCFTLTFFYSDLWVDGVVRPFCTVFFRTYYQIPFWDSLQNAMNPWGLMQMTAGVFTDQNMKYGAYVPQTKPLTGSVIFVLLTFVILIVLFQRRAAETAENPFCNRKTESAVKILFLIPLSLVTGRFFMLFGTNPFWAGFLGMIVGMILWYLFFCLALGVKFKTGLKPREGVAIFLLSAGVLSAFSFFSESYNTYLPAEDKTVRAAAAIGGMDGGSGFKQEAPLDLAGQMERRLSQTYLEGEEMKMLRRWLENLGKTKGSQDKGVLTWVWASYTKEGGTTVYRKYPVYSMEEVEGFQDIYELANYKEGLYPMIGMTETALENWSLIWSNGIEKNFVDLDAAQKKEFLQVYAKELVELRPKDLSKHYPIGEIIWLNDSTQITTKAYLYPQFRQTLTFLSKQGLPVLKSPGDYEMVKVSAIYTNAEGGLIRRTSLTEEEINKVRKSWINAAYDINPLYYHTDTGCVYEIRVKTGINGGIAEAICYSES